MSKGQVTKTLLPILAIPLLLAVMITVFQGSADSSYYVYETAVSNESVGTGDGESNAFTTTYDCKKDSVTLAYNGTTLMTASTDYNVTYAAFDPCTITTNVAAGSVAVTYTALTGTGYTPFDKVRTGTYTGFKLASLLPYVIVAMAILALIMGAFVLR